MTLATNSISDGQCAISGLSLLRLCGKLSICSVIMLFIIFLNSGIGGSHRSGGADHGRSYRPRSLDALPAEEEQKSRVERQREDDERRSK